METEDMTLEKAIEHCKEKASGCSDCAKEHKQLAEWLTELKNRRKTDKYYFARIEYP